MLEPECAKSGLLIIGSLVRAQQAEPNSKGLHRKVWPFFVAPCKSLIPSPKQTRYTVAVTTLLRETL